MNIQEWKVQFTTKHRPILTGETFSIDFESRYAPILSDFEETLDFVEEKQDGFEFESEFSSITFAFNEEKVRAIESILPAHWTLLDFIEIGSYEPMTMVEIHDGSTNIILKNEQINDTFSFDKKNVLHVLFVENPSNITETRQLIQQLQQTVYENASFHRASIRQLFSNDELKQLIFDDVSTLKQPVEALDLSMRSYNGLRRENYETVFDVIWNTPDKLKGIAQLGFMSHAEIVQKINNMNLPWNIQEKLLVP